MECPQQKHQSIFFAIVALSTLHLIFRIASIVFVFPQVSSFGFDPRGFMATCQDAMNTYRNSKEPNFFMGPTLYDSDNKYLVNNEVSRLFSLCP